MNTKQTLKEMAQLTILSGRVSDLQIKNLKTFPLIFFDSITEAKLEYDLQTNKSANDTPAQCNSLVSYYLTLDETKNNHLENRFLALEHAVRSLFWSDIQVEVYFNKKIVFKSVKE